MPAASRTAATRPARRFAAAMCSRANGTFPSTSARSAAARWRPTIRANPSGSVRNSFRTPLSSSFTDTSSATCGSGIRGVSRRVSLRRSSVRRPSLRRSSVRRSSERRPLASGRAPRAPAGRGPPERGRSAPGLVDLSPAGLADRSLLGLPERGLADRESLGRADRASPVLDVRRSSVLDVRRSSVFDDRESPGFDDRGRSLDGLVLDGFPVPVRGLPAGGRPAGGLALVDLPVALGPGLPGGFAELGRRVPEDDLPPDADLPLDGRDDDAEGTADPLRPTGLEMTKATRR